MSEAAAVPSTNPYGVPFIAPGLINLGAANGSALTRLANYAQAIIKSGEPIPESPFVEWCADRVTGEDKQDLTFFLQGRRGSGKSYSCLYLAKRIAIAIAKRVGGTWEDYFSLKNVATLEDTERVLELLSTTGKYQVVLIDDCSLAISNRSWNSPENRNFNALLSVCRTQRWVLLMTAPLKKHTDNQTRDMVDITGVVYKSFHKGGFNILKITSGEISQSGKEYNHRMSFAKKKIDFWVSFKPDKEMAKAYDKARDEAAIRLNTRIVETGDYKKARKSVTQEKTLAERNTEILIKKHGAAIRITLEKNPKISMNKLSAKFGISYQKISAIVEQIKNTEGGV